MRLVGAGDSLDDHVSRAAEGKLNEHATEQVRRELTRLHEKFYLRKYEVSPHPAYILFHVANLLHRKQGQYFSSIVGVVPWAKSGHVAVIFYVVVDARGRSLSSARSFVQCVDVPLHHLQTCVDNIACHFVGGIPRDGPHVSGD